METQQQDLNKSWLRKLWKLINNHKEVIQVIATVALALLTAAILIIAIINYHKFVQNVKLVADGIDKQNKSLQLQKKDLYLTHRPVVFVKIQPRNSDANSNPLKDAFFLTNTGKLPAKNVTVSIIIDKVVGGMTVFDNLQDGTPMLEETTIYPGDDLFLLPDMINIDGKVSKAQITFIIEYEGQGIEGEMTEKMKFIYAKAISKWLHVGPKYDIFSEERKKYQERLRK